MTSSKYTNPEAFKQALEQRLRSASATGTEFARRRQMLVFDRFLARVTRSFGDAAILKGGLVLELRLSRARTTKDVDLRLTGTPDHMLARLQAAGRLDLGDFMSFEVRANEDNPAIDGDSVKYEGVRFRAECRLATKLYGQPFGVDVAFGDPIAHEPDVVTAADVLKFAGIEPPTIRLYPVETHIAEKLHAYTLPRARPNSRVKDLPDLSLLASVGPLNGDELRNALEQTFAFRGSHALPSALPMPPEEWGPQYERMASDDRLGWRTLAEVWSAGYRFIDPVLASGDVGDWNPTTWSWQRR